MATMRAVQYDKYGPPEVLQVREVQTPVVVPSHVLVEVKATSVNAADVIFRSGKLKLVSGNRFPHGTGADFSGMIVAIGSGVSEYTVGQQVWGFLRPDKNSRLGPAADYVLASVDSIALRPRNIDDLEAAALSGAAGAALGVLRDALNVQPGERVLIRGASGGVGVAAVQIARALGGRVTALVRKEQIQRTRDLGAEEALDYRSIVPSSLGRFDVILDPVAKNTWAYRPLLTKRGRMAVITIGSPADALYILSSLIFGKRRVRFERSPPSHDLLRDLATLVEAGSVVPVIDSVYSVDDIAEAHRSLEAGGGFGKRVVRQTSVAVRGAVPTTEQQK